MGLKTTATIARFNGYRQRVLVLNWQQGANALDTATAVRAALADMEPFFPSGLEVVYPYDTNTIC